MNRDSIIEVIASGLLLNLINTYDIPDPIYEPSKFEALKEEVTHLLVDIENKRIKDITKGDITEIYKTILECIPYLNLDRFLDINEPRISNDCSYFLIPIKEEDLIYSVFIINRVSKGELIGEYTFTCDEINEISRKGTYPQIEEWWAEIHRIKCDNLKNYNFFTRLHK